MTDVTFIDGTTEINEAWLNPINDFYNDVFDGATTKGEAAAAIGATEGALAANLLINGGFDFWQRGNGPVAAEYVADRWVTGNGNMTTEQSTVGGSSDNGWDFSALARRINSNGGVRLAHGVELLRVGEAGPFVLGSTWTLSCHVRRDTTADVILSVSFSDIAGDDVNEVILASETQSIAAGGMFELRTLTFTIDDSPNAGNTCLRVNVQADNMTVGVNVFYIANVKLEAGSIATSFTRAGNTLAGELAMCQRYYQVIGTSSSEATAGIGIRLDITNTATYQVMQRISPTMRITPSVDDIDTLATQFTNVDITAHQGGRIQLTGEATSTASGQILRGSCTLDAEL